MTQEFTQNDEFTKGKVFVLETDKIFKPTGDALNNRFASVHEMITNDRIKCKVEIHKSAFTLMEFHPSELKEITD